MADAYPFCLSPTSKSPVQKIEAALNTSLRKTASIHAPKVERYIKYITVSKLDITSTYKDWLRIGFAFANEFGEDGRRYFHQVGQFHKKYSRLESDFQYSKCLQYNNSSSKINTFFFLCTWEGI
jgi:hypothetical protein